MQTLHTLTPTGVVIIPGRMVPPVSTVLLELGYMLMIRKTYNRHRRLWSVDSLEVVPGAAGASEDVPEDVADTVGEVLAAVGLAVRVAHGLEDDGYVTLLDVHPADEDPEQFAVGVDSATLLVIDPTYLSAEAQAAALDWADRGLAVFIGTNSDGYYPVEVHPDGVLIRRAMSADYMSPEDPDPIYRACVAEDAAADRKAFKDAVSRLEDHDSGGRGDALPSLEDILAAAAAGDGVSFGRLLRAAEGHTYVVRCEHDGPGVEA